MRPIRLSLAVIALAALCRTPLESHSRLLRFGPPDEYTPEETLYQAVPSPRVRVISYGHVPVA